MAMWVVFYLLAFITASSISPSEFNKEGDALYALRRDIKDPGNVLHSWDPTLVDPCTWFHVTRDSDNRVTRLDLRNAKLTGSLVPKLEKPERKSEELENEEGAERLDYAEEIEEPYGIFAFIVTPTRELAYPLSEQFRALGSTLQVRCTVMVGGSRSSFLEEWGRLRRPLLLS
ncbi:hypothetical protein Droror1_Dr00027609 [Drosera rotundifolia]